MLAPSKFFTLSIQEHKFIKREFIVIKCKHLIKFCGRTLVISKAIILLV